MTASCHTPRPARLVTGAETVVVLAEFDPASVSLEPLGQGAVLVLGEDGHLVAVLVSDPNAVVDSTHDRDVAVTLTVDGGVGYLYLGSPQRDPVAHTIELGHRALVVDLDREGRLVGVELLDVERWLCPAVRDAFAHR